MMVKDKPVILWSTDKYEPDIRTEEQITCPECSGQNLTFFWTDPPRACAGGVIRLVCASCDHEWIFYDDYA